VIPEQPGKILLQKTIYAERRYVKGHYRVAVERLLPEGLADGRVVEICDQPSPQDFAEVYGRREPKVGSPERLAFIGGLPGETVEVEVSWSLPRPGARRAKRMPAPLVRVTGVTVNSPMRVAPQCPVFGECGGCQLQHLSYSAQIEWKTGRVRQAVIAAGLAETSVLAAIGADEPWHYRNHMRFSVTRGGEAGLTAYGTHRVLPLSRCPIAASGINTALSLLTLPGAPAAHGSAERHRLTPPQLLIRYSEASGHMLLQPLPDQEIVGELAAEGIEVHSADMEETLRGISFRIRPSSFFQTNTEQANRMAELVLSYVPAGRGLRWVDAYCGVGTFARLIADQVGEVIAIEESASAVRDARWNLRDVDNVVLLQGKAEELLPGLSQTLDGLIIDPPRAGCRPPVLDALLTRRLPRIVYISCNPVTLARDLAYLSLAHSTYRVVSIQPLDMFPQTAHIESIALLEAR
jgi:23S rRNA (uracil1939-C5)-methyltransferase